MDALFRVQSSDAIDKRTKRSISSKMKAVVEGVSKVEAASGLKYPPYYVEVMLTVVPETTLLPSGGLGILYARTIPIETEGKVAIIVQLSAPLVLYGTKSIVRLVLAHEFLHYVELIRQFSKMDILSSMTSSSLFEEKYADSSRAVDPALVFKDKKLVRELNRKITSGLEDPKLNEKCRIKWIEKGLPMQKLQMGRNQLTVSIEAIMRSKFDPKIQELFVTKSPSGH